MKKYYLSLVCVGIILACIGVAAGLSIISSKTKKPGNDSTLLSEAEQNINVSPTPGDITPPAIPEQATNPLFVKPTTRLVFESFYQANSQTKETEETPPYFLLGLTQDKIQEYYPDWDIVEFDEGAVKLHRTVPAENNDPYVLGVKNNYVAIYQMSDDGSVSLKEITATPVSALSQDDQNKLTAGINIKNDAQLAQMLEDYGS